MFTWHQNHKGLFLLTICILVVSLLLPGCGGGEGEEEEAVLTTGEEEEAVVTEDVEEEDATEEEEEAPPPEIVWYTENNLLIKHPIYSGENLGDDIVYRYFEVLGASGEIEINVRTRDLRYDSTVEGTRTFFVEEGNKYRLSIHFSGLWDWNPLETHIGDVVVSNPPPSRFEVIVSSPSAPSPHNLTLMDVYAPSWTSLCIKEMAMEKLQGVEVISDYNYEDNCYVTHYELGKPIKTVGHRPDGTEFTKSTYNYDNSGRLIEVNGETVEGKETKTTVEWDGLILRSSLSQSKDPDGDWNQGTKTTYESARRVRSDDLDTGWHSEYYYEGIKLVSIYNLKSERERTSKTYMDEYVRPDRVEDSIGNLLVDCVYDGAKLVQTVYYPGVEDGQYIQVTEYDECGSKGDTYQKQVTA